MGLSEDKVTQPGPFVRWAGGKSKLAELIVSTFIDDFNADKNKFYEPFVGSGAVSFYMSKYIIGKNLVINDVNPDLITTYKVIQSQLPLLIKELKKLTKKVSEEDYYKIRNLKTTDEVKIAARFIYLNKTSFNGLWRVNSMGEYNVPFGKIKNPTILNKELLEANSDFLKEAKIRKGSYTSAVNDAKAGDVVYLDPPYIPLNTTASFSKYAQDDFLEIDQWALAGAIKGLTSKGVKVILSNSDTLLTNKIFGDSLELRKLDVRRSIGASADTRVLAKEILGFNYKPAGKLISNLKKK